MEHLSPSWWSKHWVWAAPLLLMAIIAPFTPSLDLAIARKFYFHADGTKGFTSQPFFDFMYDYGVLPAIITCILAALLFTASFIHHSWTRYRKPALVLILSATLGAGILVNATFKEHWGRPRPRQIIEFGGSRPFYPFYIPNLVADDSGECCRSFPCGHCSMGFYFFAFAVLGRRYQNKMLIWSGILLSLLLGGTLAFSRMAQGGHFFSDVLAGALIMWLTALVVDAFIYYSPPKKR